MAHSKDDDDVVKRIGWDRREFGKLLVGGVGALSLGTAASAQEANLRSTGAGNTADWKPTVVIVGAGLSGLIAARELRPYVSEIIILEANDHIGGRMLGQNITVTTDEGVTEHGYVDFGGQWVGPTQTAMHALLTDLQIGTFDSYEKGKSIQAWDTKTAKPEVTVFNGDVSALYMGECEAPNVFPKDDHGNVLATCKDAPFTACKPRAGEQAIWKDGLLELSGTVPCDKPWKAKDASTLDGETFQHYLDRKGAAGYTQWMPTVAARIGGSGGFEPDEASLLHMAWTQKVGPQSETPEMSLLKGGAGQIPKLLRERLMKPETGKARVEIKTSSPVTDIDCTQIGVKVTASNGSSATTYSANVVIVAIPPPLRQRINFKPELPTAYVGFMYGSSMGSMSKVHAVYDDAFWRKQCLSGSAAGNLETCEFIADSSSEDGKPGILTSFIAADRNIGLRHASEEEIKELVLKDYVYYFGPAAAKPKQFYYKNWNNALWTGGAFTSYLPPRVWTRYGEEGWRQPAISGKILWAGTETSERWPGYFDGAVRAGIRAAKEVLDGFGIVHHVILPDTNCPPTAGKVS